MTMFSLSDEVVITDWRERLDHIVETMREMSRQNDPQEMVRAYGRRMQRVMRMDRFVSVSRRGLSDGRLRVTRCSDWVEDINPWKDTDRLPVLSGGTLSRLLYDERPVILNDPVLAEDDPGREYLAGMRSVMAIPHFDQGSALNMVLIMRRDAEAFDRHSFPEMVWMSNLFGRATTTLVLADRLRAANEALDHEMRVVSEIQRSLLPRKLPHIPTMDLAVHYQTSERAGGDYYDLFRLPDGKWGILIADVSGHGTPAAVLMAITHAIAHAYPGAPGSPAGLLRHVNSHLTDRYTADATMFVTAFYGVYDPATRRLSYSSAGHPSPRVKRCSDGAIFALEVTGGLPMGILGDERYKERTVDLQPGDQIVFYTDGLTETFNPAGAMFGEEGLDRSLSICTLTAGGLLSFVLQAAESFREGRPIADDCTVLVGKIS